MATAPIRFEIKLNKSYRALQLGFLESNNPSAYKRLMSFATLNAARTFSKPMKAAAPRGATGNLKRGVTVKSGRYQRPSAVVGPLLGKGLNKPWYRWIITKGHGATRKTKIGSVTVKPVPAKPFVSQVAEDGTNQQNAIDAYYKTFEAFYNNEAFRGRILRFKRGSQR